MVDAVVRCPSRVPPSVESVERPTSYRVKDQSSGGEDPEKCPHSTSNNASPVVYGELVILGYNGFAQGERGRKRSKFVLCHKSQPNGVRRSTHYLVKTPHASKAILDSQQHSISYTLSRNQAIIVEYSPDETTDMFQVTVRFADDTALVASSESDLQMMMDKLNAIVELYGMRINEKKTKVMKITRYQYEVINITLKGCKLEQVRQYKYLGSILDDEGKCTKDVKARIAMAKQAFMKRKELLIKNISLHLKKRLVKSLIWSVALYGSETWTIRVDERRKLEAFKMWVWHNILKIKWSDKISNEDVLKLVDEERAMMGTIHKRQRKWIGHILRSENMLRDVMGRRQRGRQRIRMLDGMKDGKSYAELKEESQDRNTWRIGRSSECPIDFVVMDTIPGDRFNDRRPPQSTISRFACRILANRSSADVKSQIFAAGFDSSRNIFLGEKATKWQNNNEIDGLTTNGILIMHPKGDFCGGAVPGVWREISVGGGVYTHRPARSAPQRGNKIENEVNELKDGTLIDLCGATLLWRSSYGLSQSPTKQHLEEKVDELNAGRPQCPVGLNTLVIPRKSSTGMVNDKQPYVYLNCGHVQGLHEWGQDKDSGARTCPMCLKLMRTEEKLLKRTKDEVCWSCNERSKWRSAELILEGSIEGVKDRGRQRRTWGDDVKEWSRTTSIGDAKTAESRAKYFGHVIRHNDMQKIMMFAKIEGKRPRGRPRLTWMDNIKEWTNCSIHIAVGPIVKLCMGIEPAFYVDDGPPNYAFNPCGHMCSEKTVKYWAYVPIPHGTSGFLAICPFCATPLNGDPGFSKLIFQDNVD
ncbi:Protein pellino [Nymphon striatum]|nr:Protein pellino [Nymphon striatum]